MRARRWRLASGYQQQVGRREQSRPADVLLDAVAGRRGPVATGARLVVQYGDERAPIDEYGPPRGYAFGVVHAGHRSGREPSVIHNGQCAGADQLVPPSGEEAPPGLVPVAQQRRTEYGQQRGGRLRLPHQVPYWRIAVPRFARRDPGGRLVGDRRYGKAIRVPGEVAEGDAERVPAGDPRLYPRLGPLFGPLFAGSPRA